MRIFFHYAIAVAAIFALTAIGICALEYAMIARASSAQVQLVLAHIDATVQDVDRVTRITGGVVNEARQIERENREEIAAVNRETLATLQHVDALIRDFDVTQQRAGAAIADTSNALAPTMKQAEADLRELQPAIEQAAAIAVNLNASTADVQHEIHKLVYPPPRKWYQKYFLDPVRVAAHLISIPIR